MFTALSKLGAMIRPRPLRQSELLDLGDMKLWVNLEDEVITPFIREHRTWEPFETEMLRQVVGPRDVVFDVGANIGYYAVRFSQWVGHEGLVFAVEPEPRNQAFLRRNIALNRCRNVIPIEAAASDHDGSIELFLSPENKGDHRAYDSKDGRSAHRVRALRLGDLPAFSLLPSHRRVFVKMDTQGFEPYALAGLRPLIERFDEVQLTLEFWPYGLTNAGVDPGPWLQTLLNDRWDVYNIDLEQNRLWRTTSVAKMLELYPAPTQRFTNLLCLTRGAATPVG